MERCSCCAARLLAAEICPRCGADFSTVNDARKKARFWLKTALQDWSNSKPEQSLQALDQSISLDKTGLALKFHDFLVQQTARDVLLLVGEKKLVEAKRYLLDRRRLLLSSRRLLKLQLFIDSLILKTL